MERAATAMPQTLFASEAGNPNANARCPARSYAIRLMKGLAGG